MTSRHASSSYNTWARFTAGVSITALLLGLNMVAAQAEDVFAMDKPKVDEAVGRPGSDPYMFYVFNRQEAPAPRIERSAPIAHASLNTQSNTNR